MRGVGLILVEIVELELILIIEDGRKDVEMRHTIRVALAPVWPLSRCHLIVGVENPVYVVAHDCGRVHEAVIVQELPLPAEVIRHAAWLYSLQPESSGC